MVKCKRNARSHQVPSHITQVLATYEVATSAALSAFPLALYELLKFFKDDGEPIRAQEVGTKPQSLGLQRDGFIHKSLMG